VFKPVIAKNVLHSCELLAGTCHAFREFCVEGIQANGRRIEQLLGESLMLVTSLAPLIGYDKASAIAKHAHKHGLSLKEAALVLGDISADDFDQWVRPEQMV
jgi:fumarate hydratase class II